MSGRDLSQMSMQELFRVEAENQTGVLTAGLLALERDPGATDQLEACMRAAHSLKGAARIVDAGAGVALAHAMEDFLVAAEQHRVTFDQRHIDHLLRGVDLMIAIASAPIGQGGENGAKLRADVDRYVAELTGGLREAPAEAQADEAQAAPPAPAPRPGKKRSRAPAIIPPENSEPPSAHAVDPSASPPAHAAEASAPAREATDRVLRVTVDNLNKLLGLAGESLVESRWLKPFGQSLLRLKRLQHELAKAIDHVRAALSAHRLDDTLETTLDEARRRLADCEHFLVERLAELEQSDRHATNLAHRLYDQALACRMRPFADGVAAFRMVRDLGRELGKEIRLDIVGADTQVDRDILEKLDAPLAHLLRNAVDHGIELSEERRAAGKVPEGTVRLEAHHSAGALQIIVSDDGRGIDFEKLRQTVVDRQLATAETAARLSEAELVEFLFLPGFSLKGAVTEISGRGVGLDVVQDMLKQVRGVVRTTTELGSGTRFQLQLPLTLSVVRTLLAEVGGEPYAFPLAHIVRAMRVGDDEIRVLEGRQYFDFDGEHIGLVDAHQILGGKPVNTNGVFSVLVVGGPQSRHALVVDRFLGGRELVVQPLDPRLGKVKDISAAALMEDGSPVLIVDVADMIRSMEKLAESDRLSRVQHGPAATAEKRRKRILVVDDFLTVRELERKLLDNHGYAVEVAVDGMDGWNVLRAGGFDLVVTDIDMPRMDGIELVRLIKKDRDLKSLPVMIVSYKDREEDRQRGLDAGADYYVTKGSFQNDALVRAVADLIGEALA